MNTRKMQEKYTKNKELFCAFLLFILTKYDILVLS